MSLTFTFGFAPTTAQQPQAGNRAHVQGVRD
jgi:hypothetical protein